jgi:hypothetical protein
MTKAHCLGIWMDHSTAYLTEFTIDPMVTITIESKFTHQEQEETLNKSEKLMHNKEQHEEADYYKKIGEVVKNYMEVILFGPTKAKNELLNILKADHHFANIKMEVLNADKMNENQQHLFVKDYFSKQQIRF